MIDFWLTSDRWKNTITNIETDIYANLTADHYPMLIYARTKLQHIQMITDNYGVVPKLPHSFFVM